MNLKSMTQPLNGNAVARMWRQAYIMTVGPLIAVCITGAGFSFYQKSFVTRAEATKMVDEKIARAPYPYIEDRKWIKSEFADIDKRMDSQGTRLANVLVEIRELRRDIFGPQRRNGG